MSNQPKHPSPQDPKPKHRDMLDDEIVVPKGTSKLRFLILLTLTIITLVIFVVGDQLMMTFGGRPSSGESEVTWVGPLGARELSYSDFLDEKRREDQFVNAFGRGNKFEDEVLATELLLDELAQHSGIEVSKLDLAKAIYEGYPGLVPPMQDKKLYTSFLAQRGVSPPVFEHVLRRKLRVARYLEFVRGAAMIADPAQIDAEWKRLNPEHAFDLVELEHAKFTDEAKAAQPDEAGMRAWYDALAEPTKRSMFLGDFLPATFAAELIAYRVGGADTAEGLLAKFPLAPGEDAEQVAKDYYNQYSSVRFVRETPLPEGSAEAELTNRLIMSFDEVADIARRESLVLRAFRAWVADVKARKTAGTAIDLAAEAAALNLHHRPADGAKSDAEWKAVPELGGPFMAQAIAGTPKDDFGADVAVDRTAFSFPRVVEKNAQSAPPYERVAEKAVAKWLEQKTQELAVAKLNLVRDALPKPADAAANANPKADEATFRAAAEAQGLTVERRDWMSQEQVNNDPEASKPSHEFLRFNGFLRNLPADEVAPVQQDRMKQRSFLVRALGQRDPPVVKLTPGDLDSIRSSLESKRFQEFAEANLQPEAMAQRYKLRVRGSTRVPHPES